MSTKQNEIHPFFDLLQTVDRLRGEHGCPWDCAQSHESLKKHMIEETIEIIAAIDLFHQTGKDENLCEELGDLLFLILLQSKIAEQDGRFCIEDVIHRIDEKMKHRHPRIFSTSSEENVKKTWQELKAEEHHGTLEMTQSAKNLQKSLSGEVMELIKKYENEDNWIKSTKIS